MRTGRGATLRAIVVVLAVLTTAFPARAAPELVFISPPQRVGVGMPAGALQIQRQDSGSPLDSGEPQLTVTLSSSSSMGEFSLSRDPTGAWSSTLEVLIQTDGSFAQDAWYRDPTPGAHTITASASSYPPATQVEDVSPFGFSDDFESGTLLTTGVPPGKWTFITGAAPENSVVASMAAAHRGQFGVRHDDADSRTGAGEQNAVYLATATFSGNWYARTWIRLTRSNDLGSIIVLHAGTPGFQSRAVIDVSLRLPGAQLLVGGFDGNDVYFSDLTQTTVQLGAWHLLEVAVTGMGTPNGTRTVWLNGQQVHTRSGIYWTEPTLRIGQSSIGQPYSGNRAFIGVVDFDDYRWAVVPLASRIVLGVAPGPIYPGECVPVAVALHDSVSGADALAPYDVDVVLGFAGGSEVVGSFHPDPGCSTVAAQVRVPSGATSTTAYFRPNASGSASLAGLHVDFLPGSSSFDVTAPAPFSAIPATASIAPRGTLTFTAAGGTSAGYAWSMVTNLSGGSITPTGEYSAGPVGSVSDVVQVVDSGGNVATANVQVGPALALAPSMVSVETGRQQVFTASGGQPPYEWSLLSAPSGGGLDGSGLYTAGAVPDVTDVVVVSDAFGVTASASIEVQAPEPEPVPLSLGVGCACAQGANASTFLVWLVSLLAVGGLRARSASRSAGPRARD